MTFTGVCQDCETACRLRDYLEYAIKNGETNGLKEGLLQSSTDDSFGTAQVIFLQDTVIKLLKLLQLTAARRLSLNLYMHPSSNVCFQLGQLQHQLSDFKVAYL